MNDQFVGEKEKKAETRTATPRRSKGGTGRFAVGPAATVPRPGMEIVNPLHNQEGESWGCADSQFLVTRGLCEQ